LTHINNLHWHDQVNSLEDREKHNGHKAVCIWFTGLSASGKSTLANALQDELFNRHVQTYVLDGDNVRHGLNNNLGFSDEDRTENIRRIGEVTKLFIDAGFVIMAAFISPFQKDRNQVRSLLDEGRFIEVFVDCDLPTCEDRDPKGVYKKARKGEIKSFTGISSAYEAPNNPEIILNNGKDTELSDNVEILMHYLEERKIVADS